MKMIGTATNIHSLKATNGICSSGGSIESSIGVVIVARARSAPMMPVFSYLLSLETISIPQVDCTDFTES